MCWIKQVTEMRKQLHEELLDILTKEKLSFHELIEYLEPVKDNKSRVRIVLVRKRKPYELTIEESSQVIENCNLGLFTCPTCSKEYFENKNTSKDGPEYSDFAICPVCKTETNVMG